ncbi:MAG: OFA family MFS transporter [Oscillospiraceae bacterium]|jgi:OFA family oxalate/formate antiporter-like MFS transporter|nr:OFA family MFS transporter [Oscillospiraceae bacterium]
MTKKHGLFAVFAAIAIQLTIGIAYIWSLFQDGVAESIFAGNHADAVLTFSILLITLTMGSVIGGKLAIKYSTRRVVFIGGIIMSAGFILASFVTAQNPYFLWLTYGVMGGTGMGFTYSTTIACAQKWYPHKKGFVTGIIVASLGFGGVVLTPLIELLINKFGGAGTGEFKTFMVLGIVFLVVCSAGSIFMKNPPANHIAASVPAGTVIKGARNYSPSEMLKTPQFYLVVFSLLLACMGGLMMIGFAKPIALEKGFDEKAAAVGVMAISMFNSLGRLLWGIISDKLGRKNTILILLAGNAVLSLLVNAAEGYFVFILIAFIGFFYGGLLSNFPSLTADLFGAKHMSVNYGIVLLGFGVGAVISSQIAGHFRNLSAIVEDGVTVGYDISLMFPAFVAASCCAAAGIIMMLILKVLQKRKKAREQA